MLYHCSDPEKPRVLVLRTTEISAVNIGGTNIYSGLGPKFETKVLVEMTNLYYIKRLSEVKLLTDFDSNLREIFMMIPEKAFPCLSVTNVADFLQLSPVRGKLIFSKFSNNYSVKHLLGMQL